ncbi:MAG: TATA-box-binding protein [Desulfurococcales archaeon]|nr:TATA-box-binding protein [Desulfurococcales archaeon]
MEYSSGPLIESDPDFRPSVRIENIVATVILNQELDLHLIESRIPETEYNPERFPGLIYRLKNPKVTALIFKSGKMVITGAKSVKQLVNAVKIILRNLKNEGIDIYGKTRIQLQNIVASASLGVDVDLEKTAFVIENTMYEPEQFPGLIYRMKNPYVVLLIFSSGRMVITGAKKESEVYEAVKKVYMTLKEKGCIRPQRK